MALLFSINILQLSFEKGMLKKCCLLNSVCSVIFEALQLDELLTFWNRIDIRSQRLLYETLKGVLLDHTALQQYDRD